MSDNAASQTCLSVFFYIITVANLIGNTLVILIILTNKSMKSPMNYLLVNLAVADLTVGIFLAPKFLFIQLFAYHPEGFAGTIMCKTLTAGIFAWMGAAASVVSLVAISFERYFAVIHPYSTKLKLDMSKVKRVVVVCWVFPVALVIPCLSTYYYDKDIQSCIDKWPNQMTWLRSSFSILWLVFAGIIPTTTMFVLYSRVIYTLWFKRVEHQVQGTQLAMLKSRKKVTKMVVTVSVVYACCWLPKLIIYICSDPSMLNIRINVQYTVSLVLISLNSAINPFIYTLQSQNFRRHLKELVCCRKLRKKLRKNRVLAPIEAHSLKTATSRNSSS